MYKLLHSKPTTNKLPSQKNYLLASSIYFDILDNFWLWWLPFAKVDSVSAKRTIPSLPSATCKGASAWISLLFRTGKIGPGDLNSLQIPEKLGLSEEFCGISLL